MWNAEIGGPFVPTATLAAPYQLVLTDASLGYSPAMALVARVSLTPPLLVVPTGTAATGRRLLLVVPP
jgi:hypothetical protein